MWCGRRTTALGFVFVLATLTCGDTARADLGDCGEPISVGTDPVATDVLYTLGAAVGTHTCPPCVCNVDGGTGSQTIVATDALIVLQRTVDPTVVLACATCDQSCDQSATPECGGSCSGGGTCGSDPLGYNRCRCLTACELSSTPTCGGTCGSENPEFPNVCRAVTSGFDGEEPAPHCICIPQGITPCGGASTPECQGVCHPGSLCEDVDGSCACSALPPQGACVDAIAPTCGGICSNGEVCADQGGSCACVTFTGGEQETCNSANDAPTCGGTCGGGNACTVGIGEGYCECRTPCDIGLPPTCGGACYDPSEECVPAAISLDDATFDFCTCITR